MNSINWDGHIASLTNSETFGFVHQSAIANPLDSEKCKKTLREIKSKQTAQSKMPNVFYT